MRYFILSFLLFTGFLMAQDAKQSPVDIPTTLPKPYQWEAQHKGLKLETYYLTMRDGVQIAIDVYMPADLKEGEKLPVLLHQTRYWRRPQIRFPFSIFSNGLLGMMGKMANGFIEAGYILVNVDVRGSGASTGNRAHPWTMDEIQDGAEIVDWIIAQEWSDGNVGALGVSYSGTTAEFLLVNKHPNVKAVALMFSLFDVYDDIALPGGVHHAFFTDNWGKANAKLDNHELPTKKFIARLLVKRVAKIKGRKKMLRDAVEAHQENESVSETADGIVYRDDTDKKGLVETVDEFSPHSYLDEINASGAAVYSYAGWMDGAYPHASIKRFMNMENPGSKLIIGPWEHGGSYVVSPSEPSDAGFNHLGELLKFFDYHLKGIDTGIDEEPRVHYFTMGENKWKADSKWPPYGTTPYRLYFEADSSLGGGDLSSSIAYDVYEADTTLGSSEDSRWRSVIGMLHTPETYPDRTERDKHLMHYTSQPLPEALEVTGHPIITLNIQSNTPDAQLFAYLEMVDENGHVSYITEGTFRALHRHVSAENPPYKDVVPYHSFRKQDGEEIPEGETISLTFDLLPTSFEFPKNSRIRIAIACADVHHFENLPLKPSIQIHRSQQHPSYIDLPIMKKN